MKNNYGKTGCIIALILTTFCGIIFSGCGDESVNIPTLVESPEQYMEDKIKVQGVVESIRPKDRKLEEGETLLVLLKNLDSSIICEFLTDEYPNRLKEGAPVTVSGTVDILAGITILRECRVVE